MPSRNISRIDTADSYYHVYSRGINKQAIFADDEDKSYLLHLISRHLSKKPKLSKSGYLYPNFNRELELLTYCIMDNHFHFLLYQKEAGILKSFMQSILSAYTAYYNKKHDRRGPLFESRYKSSIINKDEYLLHVSRYIHLNPRSWMNYRFSSFKNIREGTESEWLNSEKVLVNHSSRNEYAKFVNDYEENKRILSEIKTELANL